MTQKVFHRDKTNNGGWVQKKGYLCWNQFVKGRVSVNPNRLKEWKSVFEVVGKKVDVKKRSDDRWR